MLKGLESIERGMSPGMSPVKSRHAEEAAVLQRMRCSSIQLLPETSTLLSRIPCTPVIFTSCTIKALLLRIVSDCSDDRNGEPCGTKIVRLVICSELKSETKRRPVKFMPVEKGEKTEVFATRRLLKLLMISRSQLNPEMWKVLDAFDSVVVIVLLARSTRL